MLVVLVYLCLTRLYLMLKCWRCLYYWRMCWDCWLKCLKYLCSKLEVLEVLVLLEDVLVLLGEVLDVEVGTTCVWSWYHM